MKSKSYGLQICIIIMVFFSSILGGRIFGVSLNKVCMLPLMLYLLFMSKGVTIKRRTMSLVAFYALSALSSIVSLTAPYSISIEEYTSKSLLYAIQTIILYIPMLMLLSGFSRKDELIEATKRAIVFTSRINIIVALVEFCSFFVVDVSLTNFILKFFYGIDNAAALINLGSFGVFLRPTGLNMDPAYLGIVVVFGFIFDKNIIWRILAVVTALCAMSRTSILVVVILAVYIYVKKNGLRRIKAKYFVFPIAIIITFIVLMIKVPNFENQIAGFLSRLNLSSEMKSADVGTMRHLLYIPKSMEVYLFKYNLLQKVIGFGPRMSGTILAHSDVMNAYLDSHMFTTAWTMECDVAELLLGYGLLGFILYYINVFKLKRVSEYGKALVITYFLYSIMYDISASTFSQLIMMIFLCCGESSFKYKTGEKRNA